MSDRSAVGIKRTSRLLAGNWDRRGGAGKKATNSKTSAPTSSRSAQAGPPSLKLERGADSTAHTPGGFALEKKSATANESTSPGGDPRRSPRERALDGALLHLVQPGSKHRNEHRGWRQAVLIATGPYRGSRCTSPNAVSFDFLHGTPPAPVPLACPTGRSLPLARYQSPACEWCSRTAGPRP